VRELFVGRGIVTATLPSTGAQNEFNLNQLLVLPRAAEVFGDECCRSLQMRAGCPISRKQRDGQWQVKVMRATA
jgi:hypothetical protein